MRVAVLVLVALLSGCSYFKHKPDPARNWTVDHLYNAAKSALDAGYYSKAVKYYEFLETRFPFGVYGQQSLLDLAYAYYKSNDPDSSVSACDRFIRLYPQNPRVDYAYYLRGLVNFNRGKGFTERYLPIDLAQRDTSTAMKAFKDFSVLVSRYPDSPYAKDAKQRMVYLRNLLAKHDLDVGLYYMRRGAYVAAANRAKEVIDTYEQTPSVPNALILLARAYKVLEMNDLYNDTVRVLQLNYPNHPGIGQLKEIQVK